MGSIVAGHPVYCINASPPYGTRAVEPRCQDSGVGLFGAGAPGIDPGPQVSRRVEFVRMGVGDWPSGGRASLGGSERLCYGFHKAFRDEVST